MPQAGGPHRHFSSKTLMTGRMPLEFNLGVGIPASEPSPRNSVWSSVLVNCAASRIVNGRTRTVTEIDDAPLAAMVTGENSWESEQRRARPPGSRKKQRPQARVWVVLVDARYDDVALSKLLLLALGPVNRQGSRNDNHDWQAHVILFHLHTM